MGDVADCCRASAPLAESLPRAGDAPALQLFPVSDVSIGRS
jgi:hypothetical protein